MAEYIERENAIARFIPYAHAGESIYADVVISDIKCIKAADIAKCAMVDGLRPKAFLSALWVVSATLLSV